MQSTILIVLISCILLGVSHNISTRYPQALDPHNSPERRGYDIQHMGRKPRLGKTKIMIIKFEFLLKSMQRYAKYLIFRYLVMLI